MSQRVGVHASLDLSGNANYAVYKCNLNCFTIYNVLNKNNKDFKIILIMRNNKGNRRDNPNTGRYDNYCEINWFPNIINIIITVWTIVVFINKMNYISINYKNIPKTTYRYVINPNNNQWNKPTWAPGPCVGLIW